MDPSRWQPRVGRQCALVECPDRILPILGHKRCTLALGDELAARDARERRGEVLRYETIAVGHESLLTLGISPMAVRVTHDQHMYITLVNGSLIRKELHSLQDGHAVALAIDSSAAIDKLEFC